MAPNTPQGRVGVVPRTARAPIPRRRQAAVTPRHVWRRFELWRQGRCARREPSRRQPRVGEQSRERGGRQDARDSSGVDDAFAVDGRRARGDGGDRGSDSGACVWCVMVICANERFITDCGRDRTY